MQKQRPFTRRQRARIQKAQRIEARTEAREAKQERKAYGQTLDIFKKCDPVRTEELADGFNRG